MLDFLKLIEIIFFIVYFYLIIDLFLFLSVLFGESDRIVYSLFEKEEIELIRIGREFLWSDIYLNDIFSNVIELDIMIVFLNK